MKRKKGGGMTDDRHLCMVCVVCVVCVVVVLLMRERAGRRRVLRVK
jgi:hypothetical protein